MSETALRWLIIENIVVVVVMGATICGLYWLGAGGHSFWPLLMMLAINGFTKTKPAPPQESSRE